MNDRHFDAIQEMSDLLLLRVATTYRAAERRAQSEGRLMNDQDHALITTAIKTFQQFSDRHPILMAEYEVSNGSVLQGQG